MTPAASDSHTAPLIDRVLRPFQQFIATEASSGIVLLSFTAAALWWANSPWAQTYHHVWNLSLTVGTSGVGLTMSLHDWVNDAMMAVFFFVVGLEIKREVLVGELSSRRSATFPVAAALGGMLVPATLYALVNHAGPGRAGWGVPMATDIAFALGILALLGRRVPSGLRVFLAALAIADDLGAVLVIALFYTAALDWGAMSGAAVTLAILVVFNVTGVRRPVWYVLVGILLWRFVLASGIHATIAGVLLALTIPAGTTDADPAQSPLQRIEHALQGVVAFVIMPIFALANAGVPLGGSSVPALESPITWGIVLGLVLGKPIGITLFSYLAVRARVADLPVDVGWRHVHGAGWLGGIGFTMSLFIAGLAFSNPSMLDIAKVGVLAASGIAGIVGCVLLRLVSPNQGSGNASRDVRSDEAAR